MKGKVPLRPDGIVVSKKGDNAQCPMKNVLEHTVKRLCEATDLVENVMLVEGKYSGRKKRYLCYFKYGENNKVSIPSSINNYKFW